MLSKSKYMEDILAAFPGKTLRMFLDLLLHIENAGVTINELKDYLQNLKDIELKKSKEIKRIIKEKDRLWAEKAPKCPDCGEALKIRSLISCKKANLRGWKTHLFCDINSNSVCLYEEFSLTSVEEILRELGIDL